MSSKRKETRNVLEYTTKAVAAMSAPTSRYRRDVDCHLRWVFSGLGFFILPSFWFPLILPIPIFLLACGSRNDPKGGSTSVLMPLTRETGLALSERNASPFTLHKATSPSSPGISSVPLHNPHGGRYPARNRSKDNRLLLPFF